MPKKRVTFPSLEEALTTVPKIHGHICTASYLGTRMGLYAMKHLKLDRKKDLCVGVEILTCATDGIAAATQCSFGSGRVVFLDHGKFSAIFCNRRTKDAVRVKCVEEIDEEHIAFGTKLNKFYQSLEGKDIEQAEAERRKLDETEERLIEKWSKMKDEELFEVSKVEVDPRKLQYPLEQQYIPNPITCDECGDLVERSRTIEKAGKHICKACYGWG
ncbi:MAG: FmdE family protein [Candidatus Hydrothermarchaeales archaeon]